MGKIAIAAGTPRDPGGQPHKLPRLLASLPADEAADLRAALAADPNDVNWTGIQGALEEFGHYHSLSTLKRWSNEFRARPERFS